MSTSERDTAERNLIEELTEQFLQDPKVYEYVNATIESYNLDFDTTQSMTEDQLELVCQYQNLIYIQLVSGMMRRLTGRN